MQEMDYNNEASNGIKFRQVNVNETFEKDYLWSQFVLLEKIVDFTFQYNSHSVTINLLTQQCVIMIATKACSLVSYLLINGLIIFSSL